MNEGKTSPNNPVKDVKTRLTLIIGFLLLVNAGLLVYICLPGINKYGRELLPNLNIWTEEEEDTTTEETNEEGDGEILDENTEEQTEETSTFEGEYITAEIPEGWSIVEYMDGDGSDMIVEGVQYVGLTGLDIVSPNDLVIFSMQAIDGIGLIGCSNYAVFSDDNPSYYQEQVNANTEAGVTMSEQDFTNTEYVEFDWLGTTMRRIGSVYYYDTEEGNNYFEPPCTTSLIVLEGLTYDAGSYTGESYDYGFTENATGDDYTTVDQILESMEVIEEN